MIYFLYSIWRHLSAGKCSPGYCPLVSTAANSSRKSGTEPGAILFESPQRPRAGSSCTGSTLLAGPVGALDFTGELTAALLGA
jgi:hypothetical protein